ncbi:MAG TPA: radical SAM protein [Verrucomicrobiae bacterium]|nr:radical SAM protein [Verrucomicrobiae bacterium]
MRVSLIGAELEENLGLRYMAAALEKAGHQADIIPFATEYEIPEVVRIVLRDQPDIAGLSMVFTGRGREFCRLALALREAGYRGHLIGGGHFASFNCERLLRDYPAFDSIALGEGEELICALAAGLDDLDRIPGLCYRGPDGSIATNPSRGNPEDLDALAFPKRTTFHAYFDKPIASVLTSRGCWRDCAFCSINAWYQRGGGRKFRIRSIENIVAEMKDLYFRHGVRIFNFQDDNFFLPNPVKAEQRFQELRSRLAGAGIGPIAIAVKARPDSINYGSIRVLDQLGLFRVFLGVENASENGLRHLNRKSCVTEILNALEVLNDFGVHIAYNLLMFEPDTTLDDILVNLRFMERHIENPFNFCRAEAYAGTGLEAALTAEGRLLGDYFGFDYRIKDPRCEAFHQVANYAFFNRNFSDYGLHYFNMQVDFYFQLLRRFHPEALTQSLRAAVRNFIKLTNLDTYECICRIYDFVAVADPSDQVRLRAFAGELRERVDERSTELLARGERILHWLESAYACRESGPVEIPDLPVYTARSFAASPDSQNAGGVNPFDPLGLTPVPIPYEVFKARLSRDLGERREQPVSGVS